MTSAGNSTSQLYCGALRVWETNVYVTPEMCRPPAVRSLPPAQRVDHSQRLGLEAKLLRCPGIGDTAASLVRPLATQADATAAAFRARLPHDTHTVFRARPSSVGTS